MNTLSPGLIETKRIEAIQRAKGGGRPPGQQPTLVLAPEFENIVRNSLFPLGGNKRLLFGLSSIQPQNNQQRVPDPAHPQHADEDMVAGIQRMQINQHQPANIQPQPDHPNNPAP